MTDTVTRLMALADKVIAAQDQRLGHLAQDYRQALQDELKKLAEPVVKPVAVQWLAEMIMSDCGCSTNNQRLVDRIVVRIEQYERANASPPAPQQEPDALHLVAMDLARKQAQRIADLESEIAGLESGASHLSVIIDELRSLLVEVADVFGKDGYGFPFEDGDSALIDRIRSRIESIAEPAPQLAARVPLAGDRIAELEAEVERFRQHALNEKAARQAIEQQLAALQPTATYQRIGTLYSNSWPMAASGWGFVPSGMKCCMAGYIIEKAVFVQDEK